MFPTKVDKYEEDDAENTKFDEATYTLINDVFEFVTVVWFT